MPSTAPLDVLRRRVGEELGVSGWLTVDQAMIDAFAAATGDHQFIHVDPVRAAATPFGGTVAHGFLTLSLLPRLASTTLPVIEGRALSINYGFERIRFIAPVRARANIRARFRLLGIEERSPREILSRYAVTVEIKDEEKPALAAEWLTLAVLD
jgi:acyl dehydratase